MINEMKLSGKTVTLTKELVEVFDDRFSNIGITLAKSIPNDNNISLRFHYSTI